MPTNRTRRTRNFKAPAIDPAEIYFLQHGTSEGGPPHEHMKIEFFMRQKNGWREVWEKVKDEIFADWIKKYPCTRPAAWWWFDVPPEHVKGWPKEDRFICAQRKRLGGVGTPAHEVTCSWSDFEKGIPDSWVTKFDEEYYNGRGKDKDGKPLDYSSHWEKDYKEGYFAGVAIDPNDPPIYESVAVYLKRLKLLSIKEKAYLKIHPELLKPEKVTFDEQEDL